MSKDKRLEEKEKLDAEVARSLSVVKVKEAHKQIEDIEKLRKQSSIKSIVERLSFNIEISRGIVEAITKIREKSKTYLKYKLTNDDSTKQYVDRITATFESIRFDLQRNIDVNEEDFERLFPKIKASFDTINLVIPYLNCLNVQMVDMRSYCQRLL